MPEILSEGVPVETLSPFADALLTHKLIANDGTNTGLLAVAQIFSLFVTGGTTALDTWAELVAKIESDDDAFAALMAVVATKASLTGVETLTNKTLTAPALNSPQITAPSGEFLRGFLTGLVSSNSPGDLTNDIAVTAGSAASDGATPVLMTLAAGLTKRTDSAWAAGNNQGCWLDGPSMPDGTGHLFLMWGSSGVEIGASASLNPTLPTGYNSGKRRFWSIVRASGAIVRFAQIGDESSLLTPIRDVNVTNLGTTATLYNLSVPSGIQATAMISGLSGNASATSLNYISSPDQADVAPSASVFNAFSPVAGVAAPFSMTVRTSLAGQIRARAQNASTTLSVITHGWVDTRGRS